MRTLVLDIETVPNLAWVWGLWEQNVPINMLEEQGEVICFAAKWLGEKKVHFYKGEDMIRDAWGLLDDADAVVHYNGKRFDVPHLNAEFKKVGLWPPTPFKQIDLLTVVKKRFKLPSYKLQFVATWLGLPGKADTGGFELWKGVMRDDPKAWAKMGKYNKQDVALTEQVYEELLPWIGSHPNQSLYKNEICCTKCGSERLMKRGYAYTTLSKFQQYQCMDCGSYIRDTTRALGTTLTESAL